MLPGLSIDLRLTHYVSEWLDPVLSQSVTEAVGGSDRCTLDFCVR